MPTLDTPDNLTAEEELKRDIAVELIRASNSYFYGQQIADEAKVISDWILGQDKRSES